MKILKDKQCIICGKKFDVKLRKGDKIPKKYFYSKKLSEYLSKERGIKIEYWECEKCSKGE